jgi:hypothetical protein
MSANGDLADACSKLWRDSGGLKILLCSFDGVVLSHAGPAGLIDDSVMETVAGLVADLGAQLTSQTVATEDVSVSLGDLGACATAVGGRAALVVLYDDTTSLERVRTKMRRARDVLSRLIDSPQSTVHS